MGTFRFGSALWFFKRVCEDVKFGFVLGLMKLEGGTSGLQVFVGMWNSG